jgi:biotin-(acetyl-CoA carboxylase) ligase
MQTIDPESSAFHDLLLPPGFAAVLLDEPGAAFDHARAIAEDEGAGTLVVVPRVDTVEFAVVLEPEEPLATARLAHYLGMTAMADALASHCPPEMPLVFRWPDAILFDGALLGGGRTAWPVATGEDETREDETPAWLVFGGMIRLVARLDFEAMPGRTSVAMAEVGFEDVDAPMLIESFCRHLMAGVAEWREKGPRASVMRWLERIEPGENIRHGIAPNGDLIIKGTGNPGATPDAGLSLVNALNTAAWYDPAHREPRL